MFNVSYFQAKIIYGAFHLSEKQQGIVAELSGFLQMGGRVNIDEYVQNRGYSPKDVMKAVRYMVSSHEVRGHSLVLTKGNNLVMHEHTGHKGRESVRTSGIIMRYPKPPESPISEEDFGSPNWYGKALHYPAPQIPGEEEDELEEGFEEQVVGLVNRRF